MARPSAVSRRQVLRGGTGAALTALAGLSGCVSLQITTDPASGAKEDREFALGAEVSGWRGRRPEAMDGDINPTLNLIPNEPTKLTWRNLDGEEHKLVVEDSTGETMVESPETSSQGETVTMTFEAVRGMTTYRCTYHPVRMRGKLLVSGNSA